MNKVRRKFVLYSEIAILILLAALMSVINVINFAMAAEDADLITKQIKDHGGYYDKVDAFGPRSGNDPAALQQGEQNNPQQNSSPTTGSAAGKESASGLALNRFSDNIGPMGPDSPEMNSSLRYFTVSFDENGTPSVVVYKVSAITEDEAKEIAGDLLGSAKTGWVNGTYRYRIYKHDGVKYVTVIDQGRELTSAYRILLISVCGGLVFMLLSFIILRFVGKWLFKPLEEAERKQKSFIGSIENDFRMPLTVINANTEIMERQQGESEQIKTINRQVRKMTKLVKNLSVLSLFEEKDMTKTRLNLSDLLNSALDRKKKKFEDAGIKLTTDIDSDIFIESDEDALKRALGELIDNSLKFAEGTAEFSLKKQGDRITFLQKNPAAVPAGSCDQVFDRFTRLDNAKDKDGAGLGLSYVMGVVKHIGGRASAKSAGGEFTLKIDM